MTDEAPASAIPPPEHPVQPPDYPSPEDVTSAWVWAGSLDEIIDDQVQDVFDRLGPERDRHTDWRKSTEEPWYSLAKVLDGDALMEWLCEVPY